MSVIWDVVKIMWVFWVTVNCLHYTLLTKVPQVYGEPKPLQVTVIKAEYHVVKSGETLGKIAEKYGTTWDKLFYLNRDIITDPNLIFPGQKLKYSGEVKPKVVLTKEQKMNKLVKFMFKVSGIREETKESAKRALTLRKQRILDYDVSYMSDLRDQCDDLKYWTRIYEIYQLAEAIINNTETDDEFYKLVGLAWQESHFVNVIGKHREVGFFQFLPSTVKMWLDVDNIGLANVLYEIKNNHNYSTKLALDMLRKNNWNWSWWNHGLAFEYNLNNKIYIVKREFTKI